MTNDKKFFESKKFTALVIVLGIVLILGVLGIIYHTEVQSIITSIVAFASSHQLSQGAQDAIAKWKGPAQQMFQKIDSSLTDPVIMPPAADLFNDEDRYANK